MDVEYEDTTREDELRDETQKRLHDRIEEHFIPSEPIPWCQ